MSLKKKKENNFSIISTVSFMTDTNTWKTLDFVKIFPCPDHPVKPTEPQLPFPSLPDFSEKLYVFSSFLHSFLIIIFLPPPICVMVSQSAMTSLQMITKFF